MALDAQLYELVHRGTPGDLDFYRRSLGDAGRVLELGVGYGRVLSSLYAASPTVEFTGIEQDPELLARARAALPEAVRLLEGDMRQIPPLPGQDLILAPYSVLWCLGSDDEARACFRSVRSRLGSGGRFVFDAYAADGFHRYAEPEPGDDREHFVVEVHTGTQGFAIFESSVWHPDKQAFTVRYRCEPSDGGAALEQHIEHRYLLAEQLRALLEEAGFARFELFGGFRGEPFTESSSHLVGLACVDP